MTGPPDITPFFDAGLNEQVRSALPDLLVTGLEYATHLGDGAVLIGIAVFLYWFGAEEYRNNRAFVIAVGIVALSLSVGLKGIFEWPRPITPFGPDGYGGFSFPSAHAIGAAAFYTAMAVEMKTGTKELRYVAAAAIIGVIGLSRIVLGVHYLGDVLVGIALGIAIVAVGVRFFERRPGLLFVLALFLAVVAVLLGSREFVQLSVGTAMGGSVGWYAIRNRPGTAHGAAILVLALVPLVLLALARAVGLGISINSIPLAGTHLIDVLVTLGYAIATAIVLAVPYLATYIHDRPIVVKLQTLLPFKEREVKPDAAGDEPAEIGREERDVR